MSFFHGLKKLKTLGQSLSFDCLTNLLFNLILRNESTEDGCTILSWDCLNNIPLNIMVWNIENVRANSFFWMFDWSFTKYYGIKALKTTGQFFLAIVKKAWRLWSLAHWMSCLKKWPHTWVAKLQKVKAA